MDREREEKKAPGATARGKTSARHCVASAEKQEVEGNRLHAAAAASLADLLKRTKHNVMQEYLRRIEELGQ